MKMRQSLAELEQEFRHEMQLDRSRSQMLRKRARSRTRKRWRERASEAQLDALLGARHLVDRHRGAVTIAMFETLYYLLG